MRVEFENDGKRYIYDRNDDGFLALQFFRAQAIWEFQCETQGTPPGTWGQMQATGATDADLRALSHVLIELDEEGNVVKYDDAKSPGRARAFLDELPGRYAQALKECRSDFFDAAELCDVGSAKRLGALLSGSMEGTRRVAEYMQAAEKKALRSESALRTSSSDVSDSISPESSTDDSVDATPTAPTTGTDSPSS